MISFYRSIPILGAIPSDSVQSSELESPFDASVISKKIASLCSLMRRSVDVDRILELSLPSKAVPPSHSPPRPLSKNAKKRARRKQRKGVDRSGVEQTGVKSHRADSAQTIEAIPAVLAVPASPSSRPFQPRMESEASSDVSSCPTTPSESDGACRIAVARDGAFCFYYEENLDMMRQHGLDVIYFSPLTEALPPNIAAVYLGGGVPELHAAALADNRIFRAGMKKFVEAGGVVFAEGGGLLVLCQSLQTRTGFPQQPMVGVFPFRAIMTKAKVLKGYVEVTVGDDCPIFPHRATIRGYMCSNSELVQEQHVGGIAMASEWRGTYLAGLFAGRHANGATSVMDGYSTCNVLGSYVHHHFGESPEVLEYFVQKCRQVNVVTVTNAVSSSRRIAEFLEGSVAYTPPLTPRRAYLGMTGVHSSPDLNLERKSRSRPQSLDLNALYSYETAVGVLPAPPDRRYQMPKTQSSGSLGHRTVVDNAVFDYMTPSGATSPVKVGSLADLRALGKGHDQVHPLQQIHPVLPFQQRQGIPKTSHERFQHRLSNNSECPSAISSDGSERVERAPGAGHSLSFMPTAAAMASAPTLSPNPGAMPPYLSAQPPLMPAAGASPRQFGRHVPSHMDMNTPGPYGDRNRAKSIAVCDSGVRDIIQAFDGQASRLIDVSRHGLSTPIVTDKSFGGLQSKSVQALQHFHSRRNSSDAGSELSLGESVENAIKSVFGRSSSGPMDIDFEAVAQVKPSVIILEVPLKTCDAGQPGGGSDGRGDAGGSPLSLALERIRRVSPKSKVVKLSPFSLADVLEGILTIGEAIEETSQAVAIVKKVRERLRKVVSYSQKAKLTMGLVRRPRIAILSSLHPLTVEGGWVDDLIGLVGGEPLPLAGRRKKVRISWENLTAFAPNVLVVCAPIMNNGDKSAKVFNDLCDIASQPGWWQLPAVKDGVVVICEEALLSRMGLRLVDGAEALARIVYGDAVPTCCMPRSAYLLKLRPGQRVRPRIIPNYFIAYS